MLIKRFFLILLTLLLCVATSFTVFASTTNDVISALQNSGISQSYINQAQTYFNNHSLSSTQLYEITKDINVVTSKGVKTLSDYKKLSAADKTTVANSIKDAARVAGLSIVKNSDGSYSIVDCTGNGIVNLSSSGIISNNSGNSGSASNTTATNYGNILALGSIFVIIGIAGTTIIGTKVIISKNK